MEYNNTEATTTGMRNSESSITQVPSFAVKDVKEFTCIVDAIRTLVDEATFEMNPEGLTFRGMDPSHVALVDVNIPNSGFDMFGVESAIKFGVRIDEMAKILKTFEQKEYTRIAVEENSMLQLIQDSQNASMRLMESAGGSTPLPKLNFNSKIWLGKEGVEKLLKFLELKEYVTIETNANTVTLKSKDDSGEIENKFDGSNYLQELQVKDNSRATYSNEYIKKFLKAIKPLLTSKYSNVIIEYSTKMPLRIEVRYSNVGYIHFYLAPRVQD